MVKLTSELVMRRLSDIQAPLQEVIETVSLWMMHYKDKNSIDVIVEGWLNSFKAASTDQRRIALFYVMNDVVQKAKNKHVDALIPAFQPAVLSVVEIGRKFEKVKEVMKRCIEIFRKRQVFTLASISAMESLLEADDVFDSDETGLDLDMGPIFRKTTDFITATDVVQNIMKLLNNGDFDYRERIKTGMRDREEGGHILQEVHDSIDTVIKVRHSMEAQKKKMIELIETLELTKRSFTHQKREVLVVLEAYVAFRDGIKLVHDELVDMEETGVYPGVTPPREAPSPTADDDIYATGVEKVIQHFKAPGTWDNRQAVDMEMDEEERPLAAIPKPLVVPPPAQPSLQSRIMQLGLKAMTEGVEPPKANAPEAQPDFSKPPPVHSAFSQGTSNNNSGMTAFGVPQSASSSSTDTPNTKLQEILMNLPKLEAATTSNSGGKPMSSYQLALQQMGAGGNDVEQPGILQLVTQPPPTVQAPSLVSPVIQQLISPQSHQQHQQQHYVGNFQEGAINDPRLRPPPVVPQAVTNFSPPDPRLRGAPNFQQPPPQISQISPQAANGGEQVYRGYQEPVVADPRLRGPPVNYQQQQQTEERHNIAVVDQKREDWRGDRERDGREPEDQRGRYHGGDWNRGGYRDGGGRSDYSSRPYDSGDRRQSFDRGYRGDRGEERGGYGRGNNSDRPWRGGYSDRRDGRGNWRGNRY